MEMIEISGYTKNEKFAIAKDHLIPEVLKEHGLDADKLRFEDESLKIIIEKYTREAGVRWLKKHSQKLHGTCLRRLSPVSARLPFVITPDNLAAILGKEQIRQEVARKEPVPGVVTGLAWTPVGGEILFIEGTFMPGTGKLTLTGQLGDVMKESATISSSLYPVAACRYTEWVQLYHKRYTHPRARRCDTQGRPFSRRNDILGACIVDYRENRRL